VLATFGPTQMKLGARMDVSRSPRSDATIALARRKSDSGSLETGGGTDGGRGWTCGLVEESWSLSENGLGRFSRKDAIWRMVGTFTCSAGFTCFVLIVLNEVLLEEGTEGTKASDLMVVLVLTANTTAAKPNFILRLC